MPQIPEELIQDLMKATGASRKDVEQLVQLAIGESLRNAGANTGKIGRSSASSEVETPTEASRAAGRKAGYTRSKYPHYLKRDIVLKYTLRISLRDIRPAIWRRVEVPSNISLRHLGDFILDLMGWDGSHLNQFISDDECFLPYYQREPSGEANYDWACRNLNQEDYCLSDLLVLKGDTVTFEYDFGDSWEHEIKLESQAEYKRGEARGIVYKSGKRACPPEDCGGTWGYKALLRLLAARKEGQELSDDDLSKLEWYFGTPDYDPDELDREHCLNMAEKYNE